MGGSVNYEPMRGSSGFSFNKKQGARSQGYFARHGGPNGQKVGVFRYETLPLPVTASFPSEELRIAQLRLSSFFLMDVMSTSSSHPKIFTKRGQQPTRNVTWTHAAACFPFPHENIFELYVDIPAIRGFQNFAGPKTSDSLIVIPL